MEILQGIAKDLITTVAVAAVTLLAAYATYGIQKATSKVKLQIQALQHEEQRAFLLDALDDVELLTTKTVGAIEQTTARELRELVKSGQKSREELIALGKQAAAEITAALKPEAQKVIEDNYGSFKKFLETYIEDEVLRLKANSASVATLVVQPD